MTSEVTHRGRCYFVENVTSTQQQHNYVTSINVAGAPISLSSSINSLGVILDSHLTFDDHVPAVCKACYFHVWALCHIHASIPGDVANMVAYSIVSCHLDYCNSLVAGMSKANFAELQCIRNTPVRIVTGTRRYDHVKQEVIHITLVLAKLHCLPVKGRVTFKLVTLVYNIHQTSSPPYLKSHPSDYKPIRNLRSLVKYLLEATAPRLKTSEIFPYCNCHSLEYSSSDGQRMQNSRIIQKTLETTVQNAYKSIWAVTPTPTNG